MTAEVRAATDIGLRRSQNEDRHGCWSSEDGRDPKTLVMVVADGMGGALAGEVASQLTVDYVLANCRELEDGAGADDVRRVVEEANRYVHAESLAHPERRGMGTTCTAVRVRGREGSFAHVGDSRAYRIRDGAIEQLTRDHSLVAQLVEFRHLTPEEARVDPRRNVVTRSLGVGAAVEVDAGRFEVRGGDVLVLSTDGLHGLIDNAELCTVAGQTDLDAACRELIELARDRGGPDNITVVLARFAEPS